MAEPGPAAPPAGGGGKTVTVPGFGKVKKAYAWAGAAVVAVLAVVWYRGRGGGSAAATGGVTDPDGNVCGALNPATGFCPGTPGDLAASGSAAGAGGDSGGGGASTVDATGTGSGPPFASNAAWSQYAIAYLVDNENRNPATVGDVLGSYLTGGQVDAATEEPVINDAIAVAGYPPVSGADGYPPAIRVSGSKAGGKTYAANPVTGLKAAARFTQADISWHASKNAAGYRVIVSHSGRRVQASEVTGLSTTIHDLAEGTAYQVKVLALPANSSGYSNEASILIHTKNPAAAPHPSPDIPVPLPK